MSTEDFENVDDFDSTPIEGGENDHRYSKLTDDALGKHKLTGMYKDWFLDYASYVILERAVPNVEDGLKPVQRRILHAMKRMDDGRYNKVANIIGSTMQFHPHGDASIGDALVQLGQKDLLIDCQGNWGNILTGDSAAAPRYIEARLSKFATEVVFNPKTTEWMQSYDGRNKEPVALPVKFPLLLAQGVEGIAVGLASKILPHNFNELIDASIAYLNHESFELYPDFPTGGFVDCSRYNDGLRGGAVKVRSRISKLDKKTLVITEIPYGRTTTSVIESILKANEKGKIKVRKVDDNTALHVEILVHLTNDVSPDKTIDALYAFTDCEVSISPNSCVIDDDKPLFMGVADMLKRSTDNTVRLLTLELEIHKGELLEDWHFSSLEKIFIEERIYKDKEFEESKNMDEAIAHIDLRLEPFKPKLKREITRDDILRLMEIKMGRILKFNTDKADEHILAIEEEVARIDYNLNHIIEFTINYFKRIKEKFGKGRDRKTEIRSFESIIATKVVVANQKLYIDREEGFLGTALKKAEYLCDCSDIDDVIVFRKDGTYFISKVSDKSSIGKNILHVAIFRKNDTRTIYNLVYRDGKSGSTYMKRFAVTGVTRDKEYNMTQGTAGTRILYFSANPNGEAEILRVVLKPKPRLKKLLFEEDLHNLAIKNRSSMGNILSKNEVHKITLKERGISTLGGRQIWFDESVKRINADGRGQYLGEFSGDDKIVVITDDGCYQLYSFDL
ncbi:MAG: DNA gyrase/topoisomerase IV subunit A, partial [Bacteroidota bacterium]|nr:DNA gyrase/topoisomerase IV subunit A [Bacteroidota bacterium]